MPELVRLYIRQVLIGLILGLSFTGLLLWLNVANLGHLVTATDEGPVAVMMLAVFNSLVFAGVQFAVRIMGMKIESDDGGGTRSPERVEAQPVRAEAGWPADRRQWRGR